MVPAMYEGLDFVLFVYALGLAFLAAMLLGLSDTVSSRLPWRWLGASAAALAGCVDGGSGRPHVPRSHRHRRRPRGLLRRRLCAAPRVRPASLVRRRRQERRPLGRSSSSPRWPRSDSWPGYAASRSAASYLVGGVGGLWAAAALWRYARRESRHGRPLKVAAVCMAGFVVAEFGVTVPASFPPASWVNRPWFLDVVRLSRPAAGDGLRRALRPGPLVLLPDAAQGGASGARRPQGTRTRGGRRRRHGRLCSRRALRDDACRAARGRDGP